MSTKLMGRKAWILAGVAMAAIASPAFAQSARTFDIPAQPLGSALESFGKQSGMEILFDRSQTVGKQSSALRGSYLPAEAVSRLVAGTGMRVQQPNASTFVISPAGGEASALGKPREVAEVVVTGTRLQSGAAQVEVRQFDREKIAQSGQTSVANFLNSLPEVSVRSLGNAFTNYGAQDTVRLRGLPAGSTLVLLDGRRVATSSLGSSGSFDLNLIPSALVERIDVLPVGSSAVYGSDAIGGVVNLVTRRRFEGLEVEGVYGFANQYEEKRLSAVWGAERGPLSLVVAASANKRDALYGFDRSISANNDYRPYGGLDLRTADCDPGTVRAVSGVLNGVGTPTAAIPASGANNPANYRPGPGPLCSYNALAAEVPRQGSASALLSAEYRFDSGLTLYTQNLAAYTSNDTFNLRNATARRVPASNAFNPFGQDVIVDTLWPVEAGNRYRAWSYRPLLGLRGPLPNDWDFDATAWASRLHERIQQEAQSYSPELTALLASSDPHSAINLFDPRSNDPALLRRAFAHVKDQGRRNLAAAAVVFRGPLLTLPAGALKVAWGGEYQDETFRMVAFNGGSASGRTENITGRRSGALFAEFNAPILGDVDQPLLTLSGAGRYDNYSDIGAAFTPQVGLELRPGWGLSMRAAYSEAFKAPELRFLQSSQSVSEFSGFFTDPVRNEVLGLVRYHVGGNPNLLPESGTSKSISVRWAPPRLPGLEASATFFRITEADRIVLPGIGALLGHEDLFPGRVTRAASTDGRPGRITDIDFSYVNYGGLLVEGVDLGLRYRWATERGVFTPFVNLTRTTKYVSQVTIAGPFEDRLGKANQLDVWAPRLKATFGTSWQLNNASASVQGRYTGRYLDYQSQPSTRELGGFVLVDASVQLGLQDLAPWAPGVEGTKLRVSVSNLLDAKLKFSQYSVLGFDPQQYDFIGRLVTIAITKDF